MASPFDDWDISDAKLAAQLSKERSAELESYRKALDGDLWQDWDWWIGPMPEATDSDYAFVRDEIQRGFVSRNALAETVNRHCNGVLGRDVKTSVTVRRKLGEDEQPSLDEQERIDEATDLINEWIEARRLNQEYDKVGKTLCYAGQAYQRPFVPPGELDANGQVPVADMATSMGRIYVEFPQPGAATVYTDPRTQQKVGIYLYREKKGERPSETQGQDGEERAELTYLDGDSTIIRIVGGEQTVDEQGRDANRWEYKLGRRLLISDMQRPPLIGPQVVSQQKLLNLALTMKQRNVILGGFLERVAINAQMDGTIVTDDDGKRRFVPNSIPVGAGAMTTLTGYVMEDGDGKQTITTPSMLWREPVSVDTFLATEQSAYQAILAETNQLHYSMAGDAVASGESRQVAMSAYLIDLLQTKQQIDTGFSWLLETTLSLAAVLSNQAGRYDDLRVSAECSVDPGPISSEMITTTSNLVREGQLSHRTGLVWMGVDDPDSEISAIQQEQAEAAESPNGRAVAIAEAMAQLAEEG